MVLQRCESLVLGCLLGGRGVESFGQVLGGERVVAWDRRAQSWERHGISHFAGCGGRCRGGGGCMMKVFVEFEWLRRGSGSVVFSGVRRFQYVFVAGRYDESVSWSD